VDLQRQERIVVEDGSALGKGGKVRQMRSRISRESENSGMEKRRVYNVRAAPKRPVKKGEKIRMKREGYGKEGGKGVEEGRVGRENYGGEKKDGAGENCEYNGTWGSHGHGEVV
jgi:hypothetical protein